MREVMVGTADLSPYRQALGTERLDALRAGAAELAGPLAGRTVWNINSTAAGGGVAELLHGLVPLAKALGLPVRWLVIDGDEPFFAITKRLCGLVYGSPGDGGPTGKPEQDHYRKVIRANADELTGLIKPGDVVVVHDTQPAGLLPTLRDLGALVVYRCHTGCDEPNEYSERGWDFVREYVEQAHATAFLTAPHVQAWAPDPHVIAPSIDPTSPKNAQLTSDEVVGVLRAAEVLGGRGPSDGRVRHPVTAVRDGAPPDPAVPMVVQVSRWDRLKDMAGVLTAFIAADVPGSYLTLAGSEVAGVADDPEAAQIFEECRAQWSALPAPTRARVQLLCLPMTDPRENALVVNALQRHASVVVQKSLAEGFGLTATEAMWKARPLIANGVGGLREQIVPGESGLLLDPGDEASASAAIRRLLLDGDLARRLGDGARHRVCRRYLPDRHLLDWKNLVTALLAKEPALRRRQR